MKPNLRSAIGMSAETTGHTHPDVAPGTPVSITGIKEDGYSVKVTGSWQVAGSDRGALVHETREVWFAAKNLELVI